MTEIFPIMCIISGVAGLLLSMNKKNLKKNIDLHGEEFALKNNKKIKKIGVIIIGWGLIWLGLDIFIWR